jgi:PPM family protein phosphatase
MVVVASRLASGARGEDRIAVERGAAGLLVVVADGAGGTAGGAEAAQAVCDAVVEAFRARSSGGAAWDGFLRLVDATLAKADHGGFSTAVVVEIVDGQVAGASVGDSGAWLVAPDGIVDLTERQVHKPLLGSGAARPVAFGPVSLRGRVLVGTDGLFKYASRARIASATVEGTAEAAVAALVDAVRLRNGTLQDDVAVVVCEETG